MIALSPTSTVLLRIFHSLSDKEKKTIASLIVKELEQSNQESDTTSFLLEDKVLMNRIQRDKMNQNDGITFTLTDFDRFNKSI